MAVKHGITNADLVERAAAQTGVPVFVAYALMQMESKGKNIFGHDANGMYKGQAVTQEKFEAMEKAVAEGKPSNGVGPCQITHRSFFPDARKKGLKLWDPYDNMVYGFTKLAGYLRKYPGDYQKVGRLYNGKDSYGNTFVRVVGEWKARLEEDPVSDWHLAPALVQLFKEINTQWPSRDKNSDGSIGDRAHSTRTSQHNPENGGPYDGRVNAIDVDIDGIPEDDIIPLLLKDSRTWYVIFDGHIWSRTNNFEKSEYNGTNPHTGHFHISIYPGKVEGQSKKSWGISKAVTPTPDPKPTPAPKPSGDKQVPVLSKGDVHELVWVLQGFFGLKRTTRKAPALFGSGLDTKVKAYQRAHGLERDGVVGPKTWAKILESLALPGYKL